MGKCVLPTKLKHTSSRNWIRLYPGVEPVTDGQAGLMTSNRKGGDFRIEHLLRYFKQEKQKGAKVNTNRLVPKSCMNLGLGRLQKTILRGIEVEESWGYESARRKKIRLLVHFESTKGSIINSCLFSLLTVQFGKVD